MLVTLKDRTSKNSLFVISAVQKKILNEKK